jgi:hypothetical protein
MAARKLLTLHQQNHEWPVADRLSSAACNCIGAFGAAQGLLPVQS